jgi:release factor glutamine methyltransferase
VGTGSGAIALALAKNLVDARIAATDVSRDALAVARTNAERLHLETRVEFMQGDLLEPFAGPFDLLVSNLPYIPSQRFDRLPREVRAFEPRVALDGGEDGLMVMRHLLRQIESRATRGAVAFLELSEEQGKSARELAQQILPRARVALHQDLEGLDRVIEIRLDGDG